MMSQSKHRLIIITSIFCGLCLLLSGEDVKYNPLEPIIKKEPEILDLSFRDEARSREIPIRIYLPDNNEPLPVIFFSHGLGGSSKGYSYLGKHWSSRGYIAVHVQHPGSDISVWKDKPRDERFESFKEVRNVENYLLRVKDIPAAMSQLEKWNKDKDNKLYGKLNMEKIGMAGHSFGAVTTQALSGQTTIFKNFSFTESRIKAAIVLSPSCPKRITPEKAFGDVKIPWMIMTGTKDVSIIGDTDAESRLKIFPALPTNNKYELVLYNAEHSAFSDAALPGDKETRNPNHHRVITGLSSAFWDANLKNDSVAKAWLDGAGAKSLLEENDCWQKK